jgi:hypothetical protein
MLEPTTTSTSYVESENKKENSFAICIAEDRKSEEDALVLLLTSLLRFCKTPPKIFLFGPNVDRNFETRFSCCGSLTVLRNELALPFSWDVKPEAILQILHRGYDRVMWIDSDVLVCRDLSDVFNRGRGEVLLVSEEPDIMENWGGSQRTTAWSMEVGRSLPATINTGVTIFAACHSTLLKEWAALLASDVYREAQRLPFDNRPSHLKSDQDVLTALLGSRAFAQIELDFLRSGFDILQNVAPSSYPVGARLRHSLFGWPYFIHAMRRKPWLFKETPTKLGQLSSYYDALHCEISPYVFAARKLARRYNISADWLERRTTVGLLLQATGLFLPSMAGWILAVIDSTARSLRRTITSVRLRLASNSSAPK